MVCFTPITAYRGTERTKNGKRKLVFQPQNAFAPLAHVSIKLPCGQCTGCRLERSRQWAIRCSHEASLHTANEYITLTYNDANLPPDGSLSVRDFTLFMKRLRRKMGKMRYYMCGEYGQSDDGNLGRPHYHACLFGLYLPDKKHHKNNKQGDPLYTSKILTETWGKGYALTGAVTFQSAAYVARYIMDKKNGDQSEKHYINKYGEILKPEYTNMSRRPGIGKHWLEQYPSDIYPHDFVSLMGSKKHHRVPKFYDNHYELENPEEFAIIKKSRLDRAKKFTVDNTPDRLKVREKVALARMASRSLKG